MSRQTDHILYKFQGCSTRGRRPATASRSLRTGQRQADAAGPQSIVGRRWQRNRRCDGLIKPQVTTIFGRQLQERRRARRWRQSVSEAEVEGGGRLGSRRSHKSDRSLQGVREGMKILSSSAALHPSAPSYQRSTHAADRRQSRANRPTTKPTATWLIFVPRSTSFHLPPDGMGPCDKYPTDDAHDGATEAAAAADDRDRIGR